MNILFDISLINCKKNTAVEIAEQIGNLIRTGRVEVGVKLPPIEYFADIFNVTPGVISQAWTLLRSQNMLSGVGARETRVINDYIHTLPLRYADVNTFQLPIKFDLSRASIDTELLPDLRPALNHILSVDRLNIHESQPIIPELRAAISSTWPYRAESFLASYGDYDAINYILKTFLIPGSTIAVEEPTTLTLLELLKQFKVRLIPVPRDEQGPDLDKLAEVLAQEPTIFIYQPKCHSLFGNSTGRVRIKKMAKLFEKSKTLIIEHDTMGDLFPQHSFSIGEYLPEQTLYIRSYLKAYGPDVSISVLSASATVMNQIQNIRSISIGWSSRLLQRILSWLISDRETQTKIKKARRAYNLRRNALAEALNYRGIEFKIDKSEGFNIWLKVTSERLALGMLSNQGVLAIGGRHFMVSSGKQQQDYIRISTSQLHQNDIDFIATTLASVIKLDSLNKK